MRRSAQILLCIALLLSASATRGGFVVGRPVPPAEPAVSPVIGREYSSDTDGDRIDDSLVRTRNAAAKQLAVALTPDAQTEARAKLEQFVDVELVFDSRVTQEQIDAFMALGGEVSYMYTHVSYGWHGRVPLDAVSGIPAAVGDALAVVEEPVPVVMHLDRATQTGRVRPAWVNGFAGTTGLDGDPTITIGIVDSGIDATHPDLSGRQVYWYDFTDEGEGSPIDIDQHGTHVSGIALGTGSAGGTAAGTLEFTAVGDLSATSGFYPSSVDLLSGNVTFEASAQWTGGGSTTLHLVYHTKPSGGWSSMGSSSGTTPLSVSRTTTAYTSRSYSPALLGVGSSSVGDFVVTCRFSNYPAVGDGFAKFRGVAPACRWAAAKVFRATGAGFTSWTGQAVDALVANRVAHGTKVMNLSLGTTGDPGISTSNRQKVNTAVQNGIVVCVSAGNDGREGTDGGRQVDDPGRAALALTVASANDVNELTEYTSHGFASPGSTSGQEEDYKPDVMAPGGSLGTRTGIMSPDSNSGDGPSFSDQQADDYYNIHGTSMASPFAAGCAALVIDAMQKNGTTWDFNSASNSLYVKMLLCATATESNTGREDGNYSPTLQRAGTGPDGFPAGKDKYEGYGMLNPDAAAEAVLLSYAAGDTAGDTFGGNDEDRRAWARTVSLEDGQLFDPSLDVPAGGDFDFYLYSDSPSTYGTPVILDSSTAASTGTDESLSYTPTADIDVILVVKRVSGSGAFSVTSIDRSPRTLTVESEYGMAQPPVGSEEYTWNTNLTCTITNSPVSIYSAQGVVTAVCTGWVGTGSVPALGSTTNTGSFSLTVDSSITWHWQITDLVLSNQNVSVSTNYTARDTITLRDDYIVTPTGSVGMEAGEVIRLESGFTARSGSVFRASSPEP